MLEADVLQIRGEIMDTLKDFGASDKETTNIIWKKLVPSEYDELFKQDVSKVFSDYEVSGVYINPRKSDDLTAYGYDPLMGAGVLISAEEFEAIDIVPSAVDRVAIEGIVYTIKALNYIKLAGMRLMYVAYLNEASLSAQSDERIESQEPYYPIEDGKDSTDMNSTGVNNELFSYLPAVALGTIFEDFYVTSLRNKILVEMPGVAPVTLSLSPTTYSAVELASGVQSLINASSIGTMSLVAYSDNGRFGLKSLTVGADVIMTIHSIANSIYSVVGLPIGQFNSIYDISLAEDQHYVEGNPV